MDDDTQLTVGRVAFSGPIRSALLGALLDIHLKQNTRELMARLCEAENKAQALSVACAFKDQQLQEICEFLRELALPPYRDSDRGSLLAWARARAKAILEKYEEGL